MSEQSAQQRSRALPGIHREIRVILWSTAAATLLTFISQAQLPHTPIASMEANPIAAGYLSISPLLFLAVKVLALAAGLYLVVRAYEHVPWLIIWSLRVAALVCTFDAVWDAVQVARLFRLL